MVLVESLKGFGEGEITDTGDEISFRRAGVQDGVMRKLKSGEYRVEDTCDLHGLRAEEAKACLREFLAHALAHNLRCVRIIHGKGKNSGPRGPVIKTAVNMILRKTAPVLAFTSARRVDGGTGAINVLLSASVSRSGLEGRAHVLPISLAAADRLASSRNFAFSRSWVAGANHISAPIAPNSRSRCAVSSGVP